MNTTYKLAHCSLSIRPQGRSTVLLKRIKNDAPIIIWAFKIAFLEKMWDISRSLTILVQGARFWKKAPVRWSWLVPWDLRDLLGLETKCMSDTRSAARPLRALDVRRRILIWIEFWILKVSCSQRRFLGITLNELQSMSGYSRKTK